VAGHEMSHGVTENTAGLVYSGDAGGLNEATSDIFGTAVEFYTNNAADVPDYLIGEEVDIRGNGTPLRYMDKPSKDGASRDCWSSTLGSLDPHYSSGPLNHWFYLASEGSGAKTINGVSYNSPTCNGSTVTGIGRDKVQKIWYRTLSVYLTSNSNYAAARNGAIKAAKDLYPNDATVCQGIAAAFSAIAVASGTETCGGTPPPPPPPGGGCTGDLTYSGTLSSGTSKNLASFTDSDAGTLKVCLDGPTGADFDVYLQKLYSGYYWVTVAQGTSSAADESFSYNNTAGTYRLRVTAYSGSGSFSASITE
jgi:zinc metalloprotease ZmpA